MIHAVCNRAQTSRADPRRQTGIAVSTPDVFRRCACAAVRAIVHASMDTVVRHGVPPCTFDRNKFKNRNRMKHFQTLARIVHRQDMASDGRRQAEPHA